MQAKQSKEELEKVKTLKNEINKLKEKSFKLEQEKVTLEKKLVEIDEEFTKLKINWKNVCQSKNKLVNVKRSLDEHLKERTFESIRTAQLRRNVYKELWDKIKQEQKEAEG